MITDEHIKDRTKHVLAPRNMRGVERVSGGGQRHPRVLRPRGVGAATRRRRPRQRLWVRRPLRPGDGRVAAVQRAQTSAVRSTVLRGQRDVGDHRDHPPY